MGSQEMTITEAKALQEAIMLSAYQHMVKTGKIKASGLEPLSTDHISGSTYVAVAQAVCTVLTTFVCPIVQGL